MKKITLLAVLLITAVSYGQELITDGGFESVADAGGANGTTIVQGNNSTPAGVWFSSANFASVIGLTTTEQDTGVNGIILNCLTAKAASVKQNFTLAAGTYVCSYRMKKVNATVGDDELVLKGYVRRGAGSVEQQINGGAIGTINGGGTQWITARSLLSHTAYTTVSFEFVIDAADDGGTFHVFLALPSDLAGSPLYIDNVSITEGTILATPEFEIFKFSYGPNPTNDLINLSAATNISNVEFFNVLGQKVLSTTVNATQKQVNISSLEKGLYLMNVTIDGSKGTYKIIKE